MKSIYICLLILFPIFLFGQKSKTPSPKATVNKDSLVNKIQSLKKDSIVNDYEQVFETVHNFKSKDRTFNLEVEREGRKVMIYLLVEDLKDYKEVFIQRSDETRLGMANCKYLTPQDYKLKKFTEVIFEDKYPHPGHKDSYYRIKCEDLNGVVRTFPWILLPGIR